uniref:Uncharacterized protein n=1 Tax=Anguilla anguilla TaxID=7936 RepID=A0A0E9WQ12_ANGAN
MLDSNATLSLINVLALSPILVVQPAVIFFTGS